MDMKRNELIRHDHTHTITGLDEIKKSHSFVDRLGSASTSISTSTPTNNEDIRTKIQRSEFILGHIKRQKKMYRDAIARHTARGNLSEVDVINKKYDDLDEKESKIREEVMDLVSN